ncbi:unnamed protein product, partial [Nesidiocoris tenuis]
MKGLATSTSQGAHHIKRPQLALPCAHPIYRYRQRRPCQRDQPFVPRGRVRHPAMHLARAIEITREMLVYGYDSRRIKAPKWKGISYDPCTPVFSASSEKPEGNTFPGTPRTQTTPPQLITAMNCSYPRPQQSDSTEMGILGCCLNLFLASGGSCAKKLSRIRPLTLQEYLN